MKVFKAMAAAAVLVAMTAGTARADGGIFDKLPYVVSAGGHLGDWGSSVRLPAGFGPCSETNLSVKAADGSYRAGKGLAVKGALVGASWVLLWATRKSGKTAAIRIAEGVNYGVGAWGAKSAIRNIAHCGF